MLDRRIFLTTVVGLLAAPLAAAAQEYKAGKVPRIGFLTWGSPPSPRQEVPGREAFLQGLREFGYIEGQSIAIEYRFGKADQLPALAAELVGLKLDVIVTGGTPATLAAKQATRTIPIVMLRVADAVGSGLVASLARPGGNVTGMSGFGSEIFGKGLQLLKEAVPKISRLGVMMDPTNAAQLAIMNEEETAAKVLGMTVQRIEVKRGADLDGAFVAARRGRAEALQVYPVVFVNPERLAELAIKNRLPTLAILREFVDAGTLMFYGASFLYSVRRVSYFVDKILKGAKPADLPVEQPTKFELVINLKTAKALGLTIPQSLLLRADEVIQ